MGCYERTRGSEEEFTASGSRSISAAGIPDEYSHTERKRAPRSLVAGPERLGGNRMHPFDALYRLSDERNKL